MHRAVQSAERLFDGARQRVRDLFASHDQPLEVTPYRTYGTPERLEVRGRVLVRRSLPPAQSTDSWLRNVRRTVRSFLTYEMPDVEVTVERRGETAGGRTDEEGYFRVELPIQGAIGWTQASVQVKRADTVQAQVLVPAPSSRYLVISDIDDTLLPTGATRTATLIRTTLLGNAFTRAPFPGIAEFFASLVGGAAGSEDNPIFYVSSSPWNLYPFMRTFFAAHGLPVGPVILRDFGIDRQKFIHGPHEDHKLHEIRRILDTYPDLACVLVGDSGQRDPEIYATIAAEYTDRIRAIYVREIGDEPRFDQVKALAADLPVPLVSAGTTAAFHEHARSIGLIAGS
jgi:phosphatidate phosphatase APP1